MGCFSHRSKKKSGDVSELLQSSQLFTRQQQQRSLLSEIGSDDNNSKQLTSEYGFPVVSDEANHSRPLPLPSPCPQAVVKPHAYILPHPKLVHANTATTMAAAEHEDVDCSGLIGQGLIKAKVFPCDHQPLPLRSDALSISPGLRSFSFETVASACDQFSPWNLVGDDNISYAGVLKIGSKRNNHQNVVISRLSHSGFFKNAYEDLMERISELSAISCNHASHLCRVLGFHADDAKSEHFLVYEKLHNGSLHDLIFNVSISLDWPTRMKIAHCTAEALSSIHDSCREQILYRDFRLSHIQVDEEYRSKLSGYSFLNWSKQEHASMDERGNAYCAPETTNGGTVTPKSNVWSFGVVLLELITGKKNTDEMILKDKKNLVTWAKPFLMDESRLFLIMDSKLKGRFPSKGAKIIADLVLQCLQLDPIRRPTMKVVVELVKYVEEGGQPRTLVASSSFKSGIPAKETLPYVNSTPKFDIVECPPLKHLVIPPRSCAYAEGGCHNYQMSAPLERVNEI